MLWVWFSETRGTGISSAIRLIISQHHRILACSELSSDVPGLLTHFLKHLSDIF